MRTLLDKMLRGSIKLVMLTGVAFTVTACYGTPPREYYNEPEYQADAQQVEQQLVQTDQDR